MVKFLPSAGDIVPACEHVSTATVHIPLMQWQCDKTASQPEDDSPGTKAQALQDVAGLQISLGISVAGLARLQGLLEEGCDVLPNYRNVMHRMYHDSMSDDEKKTVSVELFESFLTNPIPGHWEDFDFTASIATFRKLVQGVVENNSCLKFGSAQSFKKYMHSKHAGKKRKRRLQTRPTKLHGVLVSESSGIYIPVDQAATALKNSVVMFYCNPNQPQSPSCCVKIFSNCVHVVGVKDNDSLVRALHSCLSYYERALRKVTAVDLSQSSVSLVNLGYEMSLAENTSIDLVSLQEAVNSNQFPMHFRSVLNQPKYAGLNVKVKTMMFLEEDEQHFLRRECTGLEEEIHKQCSTAAQYHLNHVLVDIKAMTQQHKALLSIQQDLVTILLFSSGKMTVCCPWGRLEKLFKAATTVTQVELTSRILESINAMVHMFQSCIAASSLRKVFHLTQDPAP